MEGLIDVLFVSRIFRRVVYLVVAAAFIYLVVTSVQVVAASRAPTAVAAAVPSSAIVAVGTPSGPHGVTADLHARCNQAVALFKGKRARVVITTGGRPSAADPVEAAVLAHCVESYGVPRRDVEEIAVNGLPAQLHAVSLSDSASSGARVIIVADPLETKWVLGVAAAEGLKASVSPDPAPKPSIWSTLGKVWSQSLAVGFGRIFGYANTGWVSG